MLEDVKAGDELLLSGFGTRDQVVEVERTTPKFIVLKGGLKWMKFSKENGCQYPSEKWGNKYVSILTDEKRADITAYAQSEWLQAFTWHRLDNETLNDLAQFFHERGFDTVPLAKKASK
jgi:hypothetical protein